MSKFCWSDTRLVIHSSKHLKKRNIRAQYFHTSLSKVKLICLNCLPDSRWDRRQEETCLRRILCEWLVRTDPGRRKRICCAAFRPNMDTCLSNRWNGRAYMNVLRNAITKDKITFIYIKPWLFRMKFF